MAISVKQIFKSKTVDFNIVASAVSSLLLAVGVPIPPSILISVFTLGNILLRFLTKKSLAEK